MDRWRTLWCDDIGKAWKEDVNSADSFNALAATIRSEWAAIAHDAFTEVTNSTEDEWPEFKAGLESERRKTFAGEHWAGRWGHVLIPDVFIRLAEVIPASASMPLPVAVDRLTALGHLVKSGAVWLVPSGGESSD